MAIRVIQCGTGKIGVHALRGVINHPELELVGLWVNSDSKVGVDAGDLCGLGASDVLGTKDVDALMDLGADVLLYLAEGRVRERDAVTDIARFLGRGVDVASTSLLSMIYPAAVSEERRAPLDEACRRGGSTFYSTGLDPGWAGCQLAISLLRGVDQVRCVTVAELVDYSHIASPWLLRDWLGFGQPLDYEAPFFETGQATDLWRGQLIQIAEFLGEPLTDIRFEKEVAPSFTDLETASGTIDAGTVGAFKFRVKGMVGEHPLVVAEHTTRVGPDVAPTWPKPRGARDDHAYFVRVEATPDLYLELDFDTAEGERNVGPSTMTAMQAVNSIPAVHAARSGFLGWNDLPEYTSRKVCLPGEPRSGDEPSPPLDGVMANDVSGARVEVAPDGHVFFVEPEESIYAAAIRSGLRWPSVCGGEAICGRCFFLTEAGAENMSDMQEAERDRLSITKRPPEARLACQTKIRGPVRVYKRTVKIITP